MEKTIQHKEKSMTFESIEFIGQDNMQVSDGYHTMDELYEHRIILWIALCQMTEYRNQVWKQQGVKMSGENDVWRSKLHSDGSSYDGWFVLGIGKNKGSQRTYHLPESVWEKAEFAETLEKAPDFDGHRSNDVLNRIENI